MWSETGCTGPDGAGFRGGKPGAGAAPWFPSRNRAGTGCPQGPPRPGRRVVVPRSIAGAGNRPLGPDALTSLVDRKLPQPPPASFLGGGPRNGGRVLA